MITAGEFAQDIVLHPLPTIAGDVGGVDINAYFSVRFEFGRHDIRSILENDVSEFKALT